MNGVAEEKLVLDRVEEDRALFEREDGGFLELPCALLPEAYAEGDIFSYDGYTLIPLDRETEERSDRIRQKMDLLFSDPPEES